MTISRFSALAASLALTTLLAVGCKKDKDNEPTGTGSVSLEMQSVVGTLPLALSTQTYTTAAGDAFKVDIFKYYVSNVELQKTDGTYLALPNTYFLVDESAPASTSLPLSDVPAGDYTGLRFVVGVDSARTKAGTLTGVLASGQNMWWAWTDEFINLKLEGTSPQSPRGGLVFHLAGYKGANGTRTTMRTVALPFPNGAKLLVRANQEPEVHLYADVLGLFSGPNPVRFATTSNAMSTTLMPNAPAGARTTVQLADNVAAGMFRIDHIHASH